MREEESLSKELRRASECAEPKSGIFGMGKVAEMESGEEE